MATLPARPDALDPSRDVFKDWDKVPLFMQSLPSELDSSRNDGENENGVGKDNVALEALQSLMYEGTPEETAQSLKETANEYFRGKEYRKALSFYEQALRELGKDLSLETKRTLWANKAACNLELQNYGSTLRDCALIMAPPSVEDSTTLKALYRSSVALFKLEKFEESLDCIERWMQLNSRIGGGSANPLIKKLRADVEGQWQKKLDYVESVERKRREDEESKVVLLKELKSRRLLLPKNFDPSFISCPSDVPPPSYSPTEGGISYPVFLLSPFSTPPTRDLIVSFSEQATFADALPQDVLEQCGIFAVTRKGRILKMGKKIVLAKLIDGCWKDAEKDGLELKDGWCLEFYLIQKGREKEWSEEMRKNL
ncbi:hypothetical protein BT69DRAFT_1346846 [Atractiella rhizophila]|nr:hypothetical protein BT69DRAFT_1346846 [Atractiella rhizophila]